MANEIIGSIRGLTNGYAQTQKTLAEQNRRAEAAISPPALDTLELSDAAKQMLSEPPFDAAKVESIKQAIANGDYPLDARRMAESFSSLESLMEQASTAAVAPEAKP
jgi:flagellar biosynthesis anti-sigma factor FlgM